MPRVCASSRRSPRNDSLLRPRRFCRATPRAGPPACRRPSASTDRGGGGRTPPRTPSIAAGSVVAAPPTVAVTREVFFQPSSRRRRGGRWSWLRAGAPRPGRTAAGAVERRHGTPRSPRGPSSPPRPLWRSPERCFPAVVASQERREVELFSSVRCPPHGVARRIGPVSLARGSD